MNRSSGVVPAAAILAALLLAVETFAGSDPVADHDWLHVDDRALEAIGIDPSALVFDEAKEQEWTQAEHAYVDVLLRFSVRIDGQQKIGVQRVIARRFLSDEGVRQGGNLSWGVRAGLEDLYLQNATVIMPDGSVRPVDLRHAQVASGVSPSVFTDVYNVVLPFEGLTPGATAVLAMESVRHVARWPFPWSLQFYPQQLVPVSRFELEVTWPGGAAAPTWTTNSDLVACDLEGDDRLRCSARDVPAWVVDPEAITIADELPQLIVSEPQSWSDIARAEAGLIGRSVESAGSLRAVVDRIVGNAETDDDKLERIHRFVADEIRYVSLSHGTSAVTPAPVARTLDRRYGDCKDKVTLFLALSQEAGLDAYPVLVATNRRDPEALVAPSWKHFDHLIVCLAGEGPEGETCLETTDPNTATGWLPPSLYGAVALSVTGGDVRPRAIETPRIVWEIEIESRNTLRCDGALEEELDRTFHGPSAGLFRGLLRSMNQEDRERWMIDAYHMAMGETDEPEVAVVGLEDVEAPLTLTTSMTYEAGPLDAFTEYVEPDSWLLHYASWFETVNERRAYTLPGTRIRSVVSYQICPERVVGFTGAELAMLSPFGELRRRYDRVPGGIEVVTLLELPSRSVDPDDLGDFKRFLTRSLAQTGIWFSLTEDSGVNR